MYLLFFEHLCLLCLTYPSLSFLLSVHYSASILILSCSHENRFAENGLCPVLSSVLRIFPCFQPSFILFLLLSVSCLYQSPSRSFGLLGFFCLLILCFFLVFSFSLFFFSCVLAPLSCSFLFLRFFSVGLRRKWFQYQEIPGNLLVLKSFSTQDLCRPFFSHSSGRLSRWSWLDGHSCKISQKKSIKMGQNRTRRTLNCLKTKRLKMKKMITRESPGTEIIFYTRFV